MGILTQISIPETTKTANTEKISEIRTGLSTLETAKEQKTEETFDRAGEADTTLVAEVEEVEEADEAVEVAEGEEVACRHKQPHSPKTHTCQATESAVVTVKVTTEIQGLVWLENLLLIWR